MDIKIEKTITKAHLPRKIRIVRNKARSTRKPLVEILDDDAGLAHAAVARFIAQQRKLSDRPELAEGGALALILQIDQLRRERGVVLVQGNQHLVAERRERVEVERQRHPSPLMETTCVAFDIGAPLRLALRN